MRTLGAETVIAGRGDQRPDRGALRHAGAVRLVAGARHAGKAPDTLEITDIVLTRQPPVLKRPLEMMMADVVGSPLQERYCHWRLERLPDRGYIAIVELVLQRFRSSRNHYLAARQQRWNKVGEGFSRASSGFGNEHRVGRDRFRNGLRHLDLKWPRAEGGYRTRQRPVRHEDGAQVWNRCVLVRIDRLARV